VAVADLPAQRAEPQYQAVTVGTAGAAPAVVVVQAQEYLEPPEGAAA